MNAFQRMVIKRALKKAVMDDNWREMESLLDQCCDDAHLFEFAAKLLLDESRRRNLAYERREGK